MKRALLYLLIVLTLTACGSPQPAEAATKAQSIQFLLSQVRSSTTSLAGGKVYAYAAGTTTAKTMWIDRNKSTAAANPYTLDANGTAQLYGDGLYRFVIKTSAGVTVYDRDNIHIIDAASDIASVIPEYILGYTPGCSTMAEAVATIGTTPATLKYTGASVTANLTIPATLELMPLNGAVIHHGAYTISYAGSTARWPLAQIFNGTGLVSLTSGVVCPEWFQTNSVPGTTEMSGAIQKAVDSLPSGTNFASFPLGGTVSYDRVRYKVSTRINTKRGVSHVGQGPESTQFMVATANGLFYSEDTGNSRQDRHIFKSFGVIQSGVAPTSGGAIELMEGALKSQSAHVEDVHVEGTFYGIHAQALIASSVENSRITGTVSNGIRLDGTVASTSVRLSDGYVDVAGGDGVYVKFAAYVTINNFASDSNMGRGYHLEGIEGLTLNSPGAEQNVGTSQINIKGCTGVVINGGQTITPAANLASHGISLDANVSAVQINGTNFRSQTGNTGYAIYGGGLQTEPVVLSECVFNLGYLADQVYQQSDAALRIEFKNCKMREAATPNVPGLHHQVFNAQTVEGLVYGSPGSIALAPGNPEMSTAYIKRYGKNTSRGWYNLIGFQLAAGAIGSGTFTKGEIVWNTAAAPGGFAGWYCTTSGSYGSNPASTATTTSGSAVVTLSAAGVAVGRYITIAGVTGTKRVESIVGTTMTLDSTCDASVSGAAIAYPAPVLKTFGAISP